MSDDRLASALCVLAPLFSSDAGIPSLSMPWAAADKSANSVPVSPEAGRLWRLSMRGTAVKKGRCRTKRSDRPRRSVCRSPGGRQRSIPSVDKQHAKARFSASGPLRK